MAETRDFSLFTRPRPDGGSQMEIAIEGINCGGCINRIENTVKHLPGVADARLNFTNRRLTIAWQDPRFEPGSAIDALGRMGYRAYPFAARNAEEEDAKQAKFLLRCLAVAGFAAMNIMLLSVSVWSGNVTDITPETRDLFHWLSALIALPAAAYAGRPFFMSAYRALAGRRTNMDVPISIGIILALGLSLAETITHAEHAYFDSAVMLIFFLLCGRYLDHAMRQKTRAVAGNLAALKAETAYRMLDSGELVQVPAAALEMGQCILVRAGERVAADGIVVSGRSSLDQSLITGETLPHKVGSGDTVYAGSINLEGTLTLRVTGAAENSLIDEIDRLLDKAVKARSRYVRLADRAAGYYAPVVHSAAALTFAGWMLAGAGFHTSILIAISVLIITCPCALALAIPAVQVVAAGKLFRSGIFLNAGDAIERLAEADTIVFDKTGTLTLPEPRVINAHIIDPDMTVAAARLALASRHPLAAALARHTDVTAPFDKAVEEPGRGVGATVDDRTMRLGSAEFCDIIGDPAFAEAERLGASTICFRWGERQAVFIVHQSLRPGAADAIAALAARGFDIHILSGDRPAAVAQIATALSVRNWQGGMTPAEKVAALEGMKAQGRRVLMVGDGINDAPSLAAAYVSMSPITAADLSQAQADAVFLGERLDPVIETVTAARKARRLMHQNLALAVIYNAIAVPLAVAGLVTPLIAALAMSGSSLLVTLNALRARSGGKAVTAIQPLESVARTA
ncbi:MAG: heavy metal translocating P-type ATPase [Pseudorhodoplanes sp.]|jgi:Cu2+-exporting ATPase|nr:heavy metal translocating P-type ATPase [Pseudorhodoplanes sp.]